ncbi:MAG: DEAD/DEAH box helicase [Atopobiaceae bacterium]|nr:DEAD/DEAH box helicase [Atopobiaceae bacterium]
MAQSGMIAAIKREAALASTYARGSELFRLGEVSSVTSAPDPDLPGIINVTGKVWGSSSEPYSVMVVFDFDNDLVYDHVCDCPAHAKYDGMCKHSVALALTYLASRGYSGMPQPTKGATAASAAPYARARGAGYYVRPKPKAYTSPQIERLISDYAARSALELEKELPKIEPVVEEPAELADLQCVMTSADVAWRYSSSDTWALGLKIQRGKVSYVVKNIAELVRAWESGAVVSYGKRLEFAHRRSAFTPAANELLELLAAMVDAQESLFAAQVSRGAGSYWESSPVRVPQKTLPISPTQIFEVLRIIGDAKVIIEDYDGSSHSYQKLKHTVSVRQANPDLDVVLATNEVGGYDIGVTPSALKPIYDGTSLALIGAKTLDVCSEEFARSLGTFCSAVLPMREPLKIREEDMQGFCAAVLPALRAHTNLFAPPGVDEYLPPTPELSFSIRLDHGLISCEAKVGYGATTIGLFDEVREGQVVRDARREMVAQRVVARYFAYGVPPMPDYVHPLPASSHVWRRSYADYVRGIVGGDLAMPDDPFFYEDDDEAYFLLFTEGLAQLAELGEVMLSERLRGVTVRSAPSVRVDASVRGGLLDLEVISDDMTADELVAYLSSYRRKQRFVRLADGDLVRLDGSVETIADLANGLGLEPEDLVDGPQELAANRTLFVDAMLKRAEGIYFERNRAFRKIVRDFETIADADFVAPENLRKVLRPYQSEGFKWLCTLGKAGFGGILADDMGLGKTLQLIAYFTHEKGERGGESDAHKPSLVVCPASLVYNWRAEAERFSPELEVACLVGSKAQRRALIVDAPSYDLLVTSYDLMRRDIDDLCMQDFACVALDEAQYVKNSATQAAKAVRRLRADVRFALTGAPIENRLLELWSIFDFLMPGVLGSSDSFSRRFANPIGSGDEQVAQSLRRLVGPFILRRNKRDVLRDLPEKSESVVMASMDGEQEKLYKASVTKLALSLKKQLPQEFAGSRIKVLAELTKLRQICCDPHLLYENYKGGSAKLDMCMELVRQAIEGGHQMLIFSQFTSMLDLIAQRLDKERVAWISLTGSTSKEARVRLVERFQSGEVPVFLISLKAGGTGLNLTAADVVIHYDPWWNLAAQNQATDRTHRIGQTREVSVFKLIAKDTIEERIVAMQEAKQDLADSVLEGEAAQSSTISRDDILALLDAAGE